MAKEKPAKCMPNQPEVRDDGEEIVHHVEACTSLFPSCRCSCGVLAADLEGIKLELVILQRDIVAVANSAASKVSKGNNQNEINRLQRELSNESEKKKQPDADLNAVQREKGKVVDRLNKTITPLENNVSMLKELNDSYKFVFNSIV